MTWLDFAGVWLPCGLQNFFRVNGEVQPKLPFETESALFDHLASKLTVIGGEPVPDRARNLCFAWFTVDRRYRLYADSDGFIVTIGSTKLLPPLAPLGYWVRRSSKNQHTEHLSGQVNRTDWLLTNFQLNLLLEGIWNSAFDPAVFLMSDEKRARDIMESFTIGSLLSELTVTGELPALDTSLDTPPILPAAVRRPIFLRALRILRNEHLLPLKWNVEATRRHLFSETMTMLHRPERLLQFASPYGTERDALFTKSSDEQLRGYVMLISAKLPLIDNLTFLAQDCLHGLVLDSRPDKAAKGEVQVLRDVFTSWDGTAQALHRNVDALERSFTSIWQDQLLHETEQVRIEEEALGELQRQQALDKATRWFDTLIFVLTLGVSFAALYLAAGGAAVLAGHTSRVLEIAAAIVAVASIVFWIGPRGFGHMLGDYLPRYEQVTRLDEILTPRRDDGHRPRRRLDGSPVP